jgi:PmbA protein
MDKSLLESCQEAVEIAKQAGANDAWISVSRSHDVNFEMRDGVLEKVEDSTSRGLAARLWVAGRYSAHSTTDLRPDELVKFLREAVAITRALQEDPFRQITDPALFDGRSTIDLELVDPRIPQVTREQRMELLQTMNARLQGQDKVLSSTSFVGNSHAHAASASSNGFQGSYESTSMYFGARVTLDDEGKRPEDMHYGVGVNWSDLPDATETADEALSRARARLGTVKGPTQKTTMVVHPRVAGTIVARLLGPLDGGSLQQRRSFWANRIDQPSVSPMLTITDEPLIVRGLASRPFDGEGIAAKPLPVIDQGVLRNYYLDTYYGRKLEMPPTTGSPSNRIIQLGDKDLAELLRDVGDGILVTSWLGGNADGNSGDFSLGVRGHLVQNGEIGGPVGEMNVTGNLLELFSSLRAIGNDPWKYSAIKAPTLVFSDVSFSGA